MLPNPTFTLRVTLTRSSTSDFMLVHEPATGLIGGLYADFVPMVDCIMNMATQAASAVTFDTEWHVYMSW